jgi:hypothetical protein
MVASAPPSAAGTKRQPTLATARPDGHVLSQIGALLDSGELQPPLIEAVFALTDIQRVHEMHTLSMQQGNVVLEVSKS